MHDHDGGEQNTALQSALLIISGAGAGAVRCGPRLDARVDDRLLLAAPLDLDRRLDELGAVEPVDDRRAVALEDRLRPAPARRRERARSRCARPRVMPGRILRDRTSIRIEIEVEVLRRRPARA